MLRRWPGGSVAPGPVGPGERPPARVGRRTRHHESRRTPHRRHHAAHPRAGPGNRSLSPQYSRRGQVLHLPAWRERWRLSWNLDCHSCDKFVLSGADLLYSRRRRPRTGRCMNTVTVSPQRWLRPANANPARSLNRTTSADCHGARGATASIPAKALPKKPLGQGNRNFDIARRGGYLHLVFGGRPRSHRGFLQVGPSETG